MLLYYVGEQSTLIASLEDNLCEDDDAAGVEASSGNRNPYAKGFFYS